MKVNMYNYTVMNKLKETRLLQKAKQRVRPADNFRSKEPHAQAV